MSAVAKILKTDGTIEELNKPWTLEKLQAAVGGNIQMVYTHMNEEMYINEEGKLLGLPYNQRATHKYGYNLHDVICGNVVVVEKNGKK